MQWVEYDDLPREYWGAGCALGIFGTSAKAQRVIPNKAYQALACGTPLVAHRSGMAPDVLADGVNGSLADVDDVDALVEKAERVIASSVLRASFASAGLETVRRYTWPKVALLYKTLYDAVRPA